MTTNTQAPSPQALPARLAPGLFLLALWGVWLLDLRLAFTHEECIGCFELRILLVLIGIPVIATTIAVLRSWASGRIPASAYLVGGSFLALLLLALLALTS